MTVNPLIQPKIPEDLLILYIRLVEKTQRRFRISLKDLLVVGNFQSTWSFHEANSDVIPVYYLQK